MIQNPNRIVFITAFHHMDDQGSYDGWTDHEIIITPSLYHGMLVRVTGKNRNDIKDYLGDLFMHTLQVETEWDRRFIDKS